MTKDIVEEMINSLVKISSKDKITRSQQQMAQPAPATGVPPVGAAPAEVPAAPAPAAPAQPPAPATPAVPPNMPQPSPSQQQQIVQQQRRDPQVVIQALMQNLRGVIPNEVIQNQIFPDVMKRGLAQTMAGNNGVIMFIFKNNSQKVWDPQKQQYTEM